MTDSIDRLRAALADRYTIGRELGSGGMATVYLAEDLKHRRKVAVKVLHPQLAAALGVERFLREIEVTANLNHPHILPLYDSGRAAEFLYYVMPYVEGESLRDRLHRDRQLPVLESLKLSAEIADALGSAHRHNVVHRDIKPENILLVEGHAVVADFGVSRAIAEAGEDRLTETGIALGTPAYLSPEQASGERELDGRSDVYALGCVLYEMLAGVPPFSGPTAESIAHQHLSAEPTPVTAVRPKVPDGVVETLARSLEKSPADRYATADEFKEALGAASLTISAPTVTGKRTVPVTGIAALGAVVAVLALLVLAKPWGVEDVPVAPGAPAAITILGDVEGSAPAEIRDLLKRLLASDIDASGVVLTLAPDEIQRGLARALKPDTTRLTPAVVRELAERGRIGIVFTPELDRVGGTYALTMRALDVVGDSVLAIERASAANDDELIGASREVVEGLWPTLAGWAGAGVRQPRPDPPITASLEAFRRLSGGAGQSGDYSAAIARLGGALEIDPEFAEAWRLLGLTYSNAGFPDSARYAYREALKYPGRLADYDRLDLEARLAGDEVARFQLHARRYRETGRVTLLYANALADMMDRYEEAVAAYEQMNEQSVFGISLMSQWNWASYLLALGRVEEAEAVARGLEGTEREHPMKAKAALRSGNWEEAERVAMEVAADPARDVRWRSDALWVISSARAAMGRIREAVSALHEMIELNQRSGREYYHPRSHQNLLILTKAAGLRPEPWQLEALQRDTTERARAVSGLWAAELGDIGLAESYIDGLPTLELGEFDRPSPEQATIALVHAWVGGLREDWEAVVRLLEPVTGDRTVRPRSSGRLANWVIAEANQELGQLESAANLYGDIASGYRLGWDDVLSYGLTYSFAHRRAALLYTRLEDYDLAEEHWLAFLDAFTDPDPEFVWMVEEARGELERIARGR